VLLLLLLEKLIGGRSAGIACPGMNADGEMIDVVFRPTVKRFGVFVYWLKRLGSLQRKGLMDHRSNI